MESPKTDTPAPTQGGGRAEWLQLAGNALTKSGEAAVAIQKLKTHPFSFVVLALLSGVVTWFGFCRDPAPGTRKAETPEIPAPAPIPAPAVTSPTPTPPRRTTHQPVKHPVIPPEKIPESAPEKWVVRARVVGDPRWPLHNGKVTLDGKPCPLGDDGDVIVNVSSPTPQQIEIHVPGYGRVIKPIVPVLLSDTATTASFTLTPN